MSHFLGLRTTAYSARRPAAAKAWYGNILGEIENPTFKVDPA